MVLMNFFAKQTDRLREQTYGSQGGWIVKEFGMDMYTLPCLKRVTSKDLLCSTGKYVAAWMKREFGGEWIHIYVWLSPFAVHLKLSQQC